MVSAIAAEISLRATNWAFAAPARPQANATASEIPAVRNAVLDMNSSPQITAAPWRAVERSFQLFGLMVSGGLLQIGGHLVDAGLGASFVLVAARGAGHPNGADRLVADLDRQRAPRRDDVGETERAGERIALQAIGKVAGRPCEGARRVGLLHGVLERGEAGAVVAH